jgi:hypothetical protein
MAMTSSFLLFVVLSFCLFSLIFSQSPITLNGFSDPACTNPTGPSVFTDTNECTAVFDRYSVDISTCNPRSTVVASFYSGINCFGPSQTLSSTDGTCTSLPNGNFGIVSCGGSVSSPSNIYAWIAAEGTIVTSNDMSLNVTRIAAGHYCINANGLGTYVPVVATLNNGASGPLAGSISANSGWGDSCNPYGPVSVTTFNTQNEAEDSAFSVFLYNESSKKAKSY